MLFLKSPFLLQQSRLAACLRTGKFPAVLVLVMLYSNVLTLKSSGTLVLSPVPLKKWIRSPLSIRSFREICSSSGSEEESVFMRCEFTVFENAADPLPLVVLPSSLNSNLFRSSTDPLLMHSTSSCCFNVFVVSYFVYCLLVGEARHLGKLGGLLPPSIPVRSL